MNIPTPGIKTAVGIGDIISMLAFGLFGVKPCPKCQQRKDVFNAVKFVPIKGDKDNG